MLSLSRRTITLAKLTSKNAKCMSSTAKFDLGPSDYVKDGMSKLESMGVAPSAHAGISNLDADTKDRKKCPVLGNNPILMNAALRESNARTYVRKFPFAIKKAQGIMLTDTDGKTWYDCLGVAGTLALGHNHPVINDAIKEFMDSGAPQQVLDMATPEKDAYITTLATTLPEELSRFHFASPAGTDVLEASVKLCKTATGRRTVLSFHGGYHGHGHGALAMMGNLDAKSVVPGLMSDVHFLPYPYKHRNPFRIEGDDGEKAVLNYIETMLDDVESGIPKPACVVMEAIQGEGGVEPVSPHALREIRRITEERDIPLIIDEVQAGNCRSGDFWAFQESGIVPDVVCMSKAVGGGQPMAVMAYKKHLDKWGPGTHTGTFRGNQIAFVAGKASIEWMQETKLHLTVRELGAQMRSAMEDLQKEAKCINHLRGRGLMQGIEIVNPTGELDSHGHLPLDGALAAEIQTQCVKRGMILERGGRGGAIMRFLVPLIVTPEELEICTGIFGEATLAAQKKLYGI